MSAYTTKVTINIFGVVAVVFLLPLLVLAQTTTTLTTSSVTSGTAAELGLASSRIPGGAAIGDFVVGPGKVELQMQPGTTQVVELQVTNRTGQTRDFLFDIEDAAGTNDGAQAIVLLGDDAGPYTLREFIQLPAERIEVAAGERVTVPVTVAIPANAEPISRYGSVLVKTVAAEGSPEAAVGAATPQLPVVARVGTLFFVTVPGEGVESGEVVGFDTVPAKHWYEAGPIDFAITFANTGSVHLNPYGELKITNIFGEQIGYQELEPWFALPDSVRTREITWERETLFGYYTATVQINRGYNDIVDTKEVSFVVVPWRYLVYTFVGLVVVLIVVRSFFSRFTFTRKI